MLSSKLFLASSISTVLDRLSYLAKIVPQETRVALVTIAAIPYGDPDTLPWIQDDKQAFEKLGYQVEAFEITEFTSPEELAISLREFQLIHVCGGNTLYLNHMFHSTGMHKICKEMVASGELIYTSSSAGALIMAPNLLSFREFLLEGIDEEKYLFDMSTDHHFGLGLIPFLVLPHANDPEIALQNAKMVSMTPGSSVPLLTLKDNQAIWLVDDKFQIIQ